MNQDGITHPGNVILRELKPYDAILYLFLFNFGVSVKVNGFLGIW